MNLMHHDNEALVPYSDKIVVTKYGLKVIPYEINELRKKLLRVGVSEKSEQILGHMGVIGLNCHED
jgi:hypothetical protein